MLDAHVYYELFWLTTGLVLGFEIGCLFTYTLRKLSEKFVNWLTKKR